MGAADSLMVKNRTRCRTEFSALILLIAAIPAAAQQTDLKLDPSKTAVTITLDAALHDVHGIFQAKPGLLQFDPNSGQLSGEILVDAKSGVTGNGMRDRKMQRDILESDRYPEISFSPDRISGVVARQGRSSVMVHGVFRIHGTSREITVPAAVDMNADSWTAMVHFTVPYAKWGMKNPSTLFLRVSDSVEIDLATGGSVIQHSAANDRAVQ